MHQHANLLQQGLHSLPQNFELLIRVAFELLRRVWFYNCG
jgi:hypothetical protein